MTVACDKTIKRLIAAGMITPAVLESVSTHPRLGKIPSYGLSSAGYDVRLQKGFKLFTRPNDGRIIDVLDFNEDDHCEYFDVEEIVIPPGGLLLGVTVETFNIPKGYIGICVGKSTWARVGAIVNVTPLEPGWGNGELVVEITNGTNQPLKIYSGVGIAQIVFHALDEEADVGYGDRAGKYQGQKGITPSRL